MRASTAGRGSCAGAGPRPVRRVEAGSGTAVRLTLGESPVSCSKEPWLNGFVRRSGLPPVSGQSLHPNAAGHETYAAILETFIRQLVESGVALNESGLPTNPKAAE